MPQQQEQERRNNTAGNEREDKRRMEEHDEGETGKNGYTRGGQHADDYEKKRESSTLWKHCVSKHGGQEQKFEMTSLAL